MGYSTSGCLGVRYDSTSTTQEHDLGTRVQMQDGGMAVYVQASGAITQYDAVAIDEDFQAAAATKALVDDGHFIAFAQVAAADNEYIWVHQTGSNINCRVANNCAADVPLYTSSTAGVLDDSSTSQTKIDGVVAVAAVTTETSTEILATWPKSTTF